jgi:multidrug efflux pump subunit AcrA (membrane-fusion protein)
MAEGSTARNTAGKTAGWTGGRGLKATIVVVVVCVAALAGLGALAWWRSAPSADQARGGPQPAAVEVAAVGVGRLEGRRAYSATLEARARVTIAPKVAGTIVSMPVDLGDVVERGQVIARLDSAEFEQASAQAAAEMAVALAQQAQAQSAAEIAARELERTRSLHAKGIASDATLDQARSAELAATSAVAVAAAQLARAQAANQAAEIRLGYSTIRAEWDEGGEGGDGEEGGEGGGRTRVIARRLAEAGDTVGANTPILSVVELDPITAVFYATQREYGRLAIGQAVSVAADAFPGRSWEGQIARIAPVFDEGSRQARVEVRVANGDLALKPGMFVRAEVVLDVAERATIVPAAALARRDGKDVVFVLGADGATVRMAPVSVLVREGERAAIEALGVPVPPGAMVVTLGQQLVGDGAAVVVPGRPTAPAETAATGAAVRPEPGPGGGA